MKSNCSDCGHGSVDRTTDRLFDRRSFFTAVAGAATAILTWPASRAEAKKLALPLEKLEKLQTVGGQAILKIRGHMILFARTAEDSVHAASPICTHKKTILGYDHEAGLYICPEHGSRYALDGEVQKGPSETPLPIFEASLSDGRVIFELPDEEEE